MKKNAFGMISLLLGLVIISVMFLLMINTFKGIGGAGIGGSLINTRSVQEEIDAQVNEIQNIRNQTIEINNNQNKSIDY